MNYQLIESTDPELYAAMDAELQRQRNNIELIASENFVSEAVMQACGSHLTNKYAEGYPGKRYYGGCVNVDLVENLAIERAKQLFGCNFANVQPHSGSNANFAAYAALIKPGDTVVGMNLDHGGHLTHGSKVNQSGKLYNIVPYGVSKETGCIDYDALREIVIANKPALIVAGASAYPRIIDFKKFREIADLVGAYLMVDMAHIAGLVAAGLHPSPFPHAHIVTTTTHKTLRGPRGGLILTNDEEIAKNVNKAIFPGTQGGPLEHIIAGKAICFKEALSDDFKVYQQKIVKNAAAMAARFIENGINLVSGGTDNHLMLVDLSAEGISGKEVEHLLDEAHITVNKNAIPFDTAKPFVTSGIRIGTPAVTTRGFDEDDCRLVADLITDVIRRREDAIERVSAKVAALCAAHPLY